jgi:branched-chain amino acid transport system permease protein
MTGKAPPLPPPQDWRDRITRAPLGTQLALFAVAVLLAIGVPWADHVRDEPMLFSNAWMTVLINVAIFAIAALGLNLVTGFTGLLNLGFAAFMAIGAYTTGILMRDGGFGMGPWPFWAAIPAGMMHAGIWGVILGYPTLRLSGDYFAIVTFGFAELTVLTAKNWDSLTGGAQGLKDVPIATIRIPGQEEPILSFTTRIGEMGPLWTLAIAMVCLAVFISWRLTHSRVGLAWRAIREDEIAAQSCGINLARYKTLVFFASAALGGLAGSLFPLLYKGVYWTQFTFLNSVYILVYVVFGGMGSHLGSVAGATILLTLLEGLRSRIDAFNQADAPFDIPAELRLMIYGVVLILVARLRPEGLFPSRRVARELHPETQRVLEQQDVSLYDLRHEAEGRLR